MWRITFRYNGLGSGHRRKLERLIDQHDLDNILRHISEMAKEARVGEGAIFMRGYTVDWVGPYED